MILTVYSALGNQQQRCLLRRLFPAFRGLRNQGWNVWSALERNPHIFWYCSGKTPQSLSVIVDRIELQVSAARQLPRPPTSGRRRRCLLDVRNRVLLVLFWLRQYPTLHVLAFLFGISKSTVAEEIYHIVPILFVNYQHYISWHSMRKWQGFLGTFPSFQNVVGVIDATIHPIRRPSGVLQAQFYRGDKKRHFMSTQMIIDGDGLIVLLVAG